MASTTGVKRKTSDKAAAAGPLSADELRKMDAYWRASNYLSVGQIYLLDNPLLKEPLKRELTDFVEAVRTRRAPMVTGEDGRRALALVTQIADKIAEETQPRKQQD